ncbi:response regulator [Nocardioides sp. HB32]|jgi:signal transduction histidine kinase
MTAPRVVLVDDTEDLRLLMRIALRRAGYEVVGEAGDGAAGIEVARTELPDLVVLDLSMPVMDGLEALPHIRAALPDATIVVMSGFGSAQMGEKAIAGGADGYLQKGAPLASVVAYLGAAMDRRGGVTTELLTTAQVRHGTLTPQLRDVRPADVVVAVLAGRYDAGVEVTDERLVHADPLRLEQMLSNLLSNARKYGRPPVDVRVRPAGPCVAIDVADHGDGVPEHFRDRLFQEFERADTSTVTGAGLGLHVVRTLAEAQGGTATYAPGPAGGAVFTIELPAV